MSTVQHDHCYNQAQTLYSCSVCRRCFPTKPGLKSHKKRHSAVKKHTCHECGKCFYTEADLHCHSVVNHGLRTRYCCKLCHNYWICEDMYVQHMRTHYGENHLYRCSPCAKSYKTIGKFWVHRALHFERKLQGVCQICFKSFTHSRILRLHKCDQFIAVKLEEDDTTTVLENDTSSIKLKNQTINTVEASNENSLKRNSCEHCSQKFGFEDLLHHLAWSKWKNNTPKVTCNVCLRIFNYRCKLQRHNRLIVCDPSTECVKCGKAFKTGFIYEQHVKFSLSCGNQAIKFVKCPDCSDQFYDKGDLNKHRKDTCLYSKTCNKSERILTCNTSQLTITGNSDYVQRIHGVRQSRTCAKPKLGTKRLKCECHDCGLEFALPNTLIEHRERGCAYRARGGDNRSRGCGNSMNSAQGVDQRAQVSNRNIGVKIQDDEHWARWCDQVIGLKLEDDEHRAQGCDQVIPRTLFEQRAQGCDQVIPKTLFEHRAQGCDPVIGVKLDDDEHRSQGCDPVIVKLEHDEHRAQGPHNIIPKTLFAHKAQGYDQVIGVKLEQDASAIKVEDDKTTDLENDASSFYLENTTIITVVKEASNKHSLIRQKAKSTKRSKILLRCKHCNQTFASEYQLNGHRAWTKREVNTSKLACDVCLREFRYRCKLEKHKKATACGNSSECLKHDKNFKRGPINEQNVPDSLSCGNQTTPASCPDCGLSCRDCKCICGYSKKKCYTCKKTFNWIQGYNFHIRYSKSCGDQKFIPKNKNLKCDDCGRMFALPKTLASHKARTCRFSPKEKPTFNCLVCNKICTCKYQLDKHMISHTKEKNYECVKCNMKFLYRTYLNDHYRENPECGKDVEFPKLNYDPEKLICECCGQVGFKNNSALNRHVRTHSSKQLDCQKCGSKFITMDGFRKHKKSVCLGDSICTICGKKGFKNKHDFYVHMSEHDANYTYKRKEAESKLVCPKCGQLFTRKYYQDNHIHHVCAHGLNCEICGRSNFKTKVEFRRHMFKHDDSYSIENERDAPVPTDNSNAKPQDLMCLTCYKSFNTISAKNKHEREHFSYTESVADSLPHETNVEGKHLASIKTVAHSFACDLCQAVYTTRMKCKQHRRVVHRDKVKCEQCGKSVNQQSMRLHMRTHTGEMPYSCATCGKRFKTGSNLNYHRTKQTCT